MNRAPIGLFYGSSTCYTEMVAEKIGAVLGPELVDIYNIHDEPLATSQYYQFLIMGIPTWDYGELQEDWEEIWDEIDELDFHHRHVAIYGLGDQIGYPEWFQDAMGYLHHKLVKLGATAAGYWPNQGYEFEQSKALTPDQQHFVGLAVDDENQFDLTDDRIARWCSQLLQEFGLTS
ncbi:MAG: flavodoxin FldB [Gammaproteobacteria bacterium]|uniref:flavodoxin FldB n=1 Tax=Pseudomaricurvus alcaniphilus TaxID=1166482 RepID=UPI001409044B|nr:flavodoxin FldB [Pseudomaricurvus alcaniphilus]MBR9912511.1 flavodoxin FldB [Gammaproteobacteria bacterium]NHN36292.1 flavodoxin FldB [Pseudomaricurvus alcaniphilus]